MGLSLHKILAALRLLCRSLILGMEQLGGLSFLLPCMFVHVKAQPTLEQGSVPQSSQEMISSIRPSLALVLGILSLMFSLTFILIVYAKFCQREADPAFHTANQRGPTTPRPGFSGIEKTVIESLPFFRFSSLKGSKAGLECAVCLSKFEEIEILRLLPRCRHAFHIGCIDQWLEDHSSCPLCRQKVSPEDVKVLTYSNSLRFLRDVSELKVDSEVELFVHREEESHSDSSRFSIGGSFRKTRKAKKEEELPIQIAGSDSGNEEPNLLHKLNHKIVVSGVACQRWSSVSSSDLMLLKSEMIDSESNKLFSCTPKWIDDGEVKEVHPGWGDSVSSSGMLRPSSTSSETVSNLGDGPRILTSTEKRSRSDITALSRFKEGNKPGQCPSSVLEDSNKGERAREIWLPIARRTVQWFANRERSQGSHNTRLSSNV